MLRFREEKWYQELGVQLIERVKVDLDEYGTIEQHPEMEGNQMVMILGPKAKIKGRKMSKMKTNRGAAKRFKKLEKADSRDLNLILIIF